MMAAQDTKSAPKVADRAQYNQGSIAHPCHPVPRDIAEALHALREEKLASLIRQHEIARQSRPSAEERQATVEFYRLIAKALGAEESLAKLLDVRRKSYRRLRESELTLPWKSPQLVPVDLRPPAPARASADFWWAETNWSNPSFYTVNTGDDGGVHFSGRYSYDDQDLFGFSFGLTGYFEIQWERLPESLLGSYVSRPFIELLGGMTGYTSGGDVFEGDCWCKCSLFVRQTVLQFNFGPSGPVPVVLAEGQQTITLINEENVYRPYPVSLPGSFKMPDLTFRPAFPGSIHAHLEVRFDCQLEGNSFLWLDQPDVNVRLFQWPVVPWKPWRPHGH